MKTFTLTIELENDALVDDQGNTDFCALGELILECGQDVRRSKDWGETSGPIRDAYGVTVGAWDIKEREV